MTEAELKYWENWKPRPMDVQFMAMMIETMRDGGVWAVPRNKTVYKLDKTRKVFILIEGGVDSLFYMNKKALEPLGWTVALPAEASLGTGAGKAQVSGLKASAALQSSVDEIASRVKWECPRCEISMNSGPSPCPVCGNLTVLIGSSNT